jgi:cation diffusion facilitator CzcD-associated flavoprotein CzcO
MSNPETNGNHPSHSFSTPHDGHPPPLADSKGYTIIEEPYGTKRPLRVILMGAGASAINFLHHLGGLSKHNLSVICYEKNDGVGGTWHENKYPGCACDIPSVNYQYSWRIQTWTKYYSPAEEIDKYLKEIEKDYGWVEKGLIKLNHKVKGACWDETKGIWHIGVQNLKTEEEIYDECEVFINAGGVLNSWKYPDIKGLHDFGGKLMHSAAYDTTFDVTGKKVAVIGAGSSGVQLVSTIQSKVDKLYHWIKSPIWITAGFAQRWAGPDGENFACKRFLPFLHSVANLFKQTHQSRSNTCKTIQKSIWSTESR